MSSPNIEFTDEIEANRAAYSDLFRKAVNIGRGWGATEDAHLTAFADAITNFVNGGDTMISAYQTESAARAQIRKIQKATGWRPEEIRVSALQAHLFLSYLLWEKGIPNLLTIGNVVKDGQEVFGPTVESLNSDLMQLSDGATPFFDAYAWLTFPDRSVIDATWWFYDRQTALPKTFSWADRLFIGEPVVEGRSYLPLVVGTKFLAGALHLPPWVQG